MKTLLQRLHPEIVHDIAQILDHTHPPSLVYFACASRGCYAIASRFLHRTIKLTITDGEHPLSEANRWEDILARDRGFAHVRRLIFLPASHDVLQHNYLSLEPCERHDNDGLDLQSCWDLYFENYKWCPYGISVLSSDEQWQSVARLVRLLTALTDIFWACRIQIPLCILEVLHDKLRRCRLHHYSFECGNETTENTITSHKQAVATSPCLYAIGDLYQNNGHRALAFIRRLNPPRLRRIHYWPGSGAIELHQADANTSQRVPLELVQLDDKLEGNAPRMPFNVVDMIASGNFSALRALKLNIYLAAEWLPAPTRFESLTTLVLTYSYKDTHVSPEYRNEAITFMRNLPHLTTLGVRAWDRAVPITPALSPNLQTLNLSTARVVGGAPLRDDHILQLPHVCPLIVKLALEVKRSRGDAAEVRRYRALGCLSRLQYLEIILDASPPGLISTTSPADRLNTHGETAIEPWFDEQDSLLLRGGLHPHREGHLRDSLINSAVDGDLARTIFGVIDRAKPYGLIPNVRRLERLELCASGGMAFPDRAVSVFPGTALKPLFDALCRNWVVERDVRDDARDVVYVRESHITQRQRMLQFHGLEKTVLRYWFGLWRRVWPIEHEGTDWWDDWQSYPLELEEVADT